MVCVGGQKMVAATFRAGVPCGRCAMVLRSLRARWKSRASMAAEVSLPVWLVCDPRRGRHMLPVSVR